jgi:hypothetical protein
MSDTTPQQRLLQRWQQADDDELLVETEWIAGQIAKAVERAARTVMEAQQREDDAS